MSTVTVPKKEYEELMKTKFRYEYLKEVLKDDVFSSPAIRNSREILKILGATKKYSRKFLASLEKGLGRSSYFQS